MAADSGEPAVGSYLRRRLRLAEPMAIQQITGGWSNVTSVVTDAAGRRVVVRRPPDGEHGGGAHDVLREARILRALADTDVAVPEVLDVHESGSAPWPFYVMDHVDGVVVHSVTFMDGLPEEDRSHLGFQLIDNLAAIQRVDLDLVGLGDLRRSAPYLDRQLRRWTSQWQTNKLREVPVVDRVAERLAKVLPALSPQPDRLVHGDFRFGNVIVSHGPSPRTLALLDWELATTGHPLADLGFLGARMHAPDGVLADGADPSAASGAPSFEGLADRFTRLTGSPVTELPAFVALSAWRWAIIVAGIERRYASGQMGRTEEDAAWHGTRVELLARLAAQWLDH